MRRFLAFSLAVLTAFQPLTGYAQAIGEGIRNADKPLPHVLPIADRADMLPLPYMPPQWMARTEADAQEARKVAVANAISMSKVVNKTTASVGDTITWTLTADNLTTIASGVLTATDTLPANISTIAVTPGSGVVCGAATAGAAFTCSIPSMAANTSNRAVATISATATAEGSLTNTATLKNSANATLNCNGVVGNCTVTTQVQDDDDSLLPTIIGALKPVCTSLSASPSSVTMGQVATVTLAANCTFRGALQRKYGFFLNGNYLGDAAAGSNAYTYSFTPTTTNNLLYSAIALNGNIPSNAIAAAPIAVTVVAPSGCSISGPASLAVNATGTFSATCSSGSGPFTYAWSRNPAFSGSGYTTQQLNDAPFANSATTSANYTVVVSNSAGSQSPTLTVANSTAVNLTISSVGAYSGISTQSSTSYPTKTLVANFTNNCTNTSPATIRVYANGTQVYSGTYQPSITFDVAVNASYRVDATMTCGGVQVAAASAQAGTSTITPYAVANVEDPNAPNATGTTVGTLSGSASVNPSGAVTYSIPVPVAQGTAGMQPSLALSYSSQAGRGILGTGWSLSGLSTVHRCPASIVIDGFKGRIGFDAQDRFCLDGMRLIVINGVDGAADSEYRTERDSYARIYSRGSNATGPLFWEVETKSGQKLTFNAPLYKAAVDGSNYDITRIKAWGISKAEDTVGNYMTFSYAATHSKGWLLPTTIDYTGNPGNANTAALAPYAQVQITYDSSSRGDSAIVYDGTGSYGEIPPVIASVTSTVDGLIAQQLNLLYESSTTTGRTRLSSAQMCGGGAGSTTGLCLPATVFNYNNAAVSTAAPWTDAGNIGFSVNPASDSILALDPRGTGKTETINGKTFLINATANAVIANAGDAASWGLSSSNCQNAIPCTSDFSSGPQLGDFDGDGRTDFVATMALTNNSTGQLETRYVVCYARVSSVTLPFDCEIKYPWGQQNGFANLKYVSVNQEGSGPLVPRFIIGDFDGDGRSDVLELGAAALSSYAQPGDSYLYSGTARGEASRILQLSGLESIDHGQADVDRLSFGDFDGDGRMDIAVLVATPASGFGAWDVMLSRVTSTTAATAGSFTRLTNVQGPRKHDYQPHIADVNGDGLADLLAFDGTPEMWTSNGVPPDYGITPYLGKFRWHGCLSRGNGTFDCSIWRGPPSGEFDFNGRKMPLEVLGDFNGDGRTDVAIYDSDYSADHPTEAGRWWLCVARPNPPGYVGPSSLPERGAFDCGPTLAGSQLQGGGIWTNGLLRKGRTQTNPNKYEYDIVVAGDFNGDGRTGLAGGTPTSGYPRISRLNVPDAVASIPDMLATVTNGLGFTNSFKYKPITDNAIYAKYNNSTTYPVLDIQTAMYVATEASHDDGIGGTKTYTYKYEGLKGHTTGGGSLGFAKVSVTDGQSGIVTTTTYDNTYPARGLVLSTEKRKPVSAGGGQLNYSTTQYKLIRPYTATATYRPAGIASFPDVAKYIHSYLPSASTESSNDWDGTPMPPTTTASDYGITTARNNTTSTTGAPVGAYFDGDVNTAFACATTVSATTNLPGSGGAQQASKTTTNTYDNGVGGWRYCRLRTADVVSTQSMYSAGTSETRRASFTYNAASGLLETETVQQGDLREITLKTTYQHDAYGNRKQADVTGWNGSPDDPITANDTTKETRTSKTTYDNRGRFAIGSENALGHQASATYSNTLGVQLTQTFDGLTAESKYDKLGRKVTELRPDGTKTAMSYSTSVTYGGVKVTVKTTGGGQSIAESDRLGREVLKSVLIDKHDGTAPVLSNVRTVYDARGRVDKVSRPYFGSVANFPCSRHYDELDRVDYEQCANDTGPSTTTSTVFNGLSTTLTVSAPDTTGAIATRSSTTLLDARGMTQKVTNAQQSTVEHAYDAAGNLVRTTRTANTGGTMITALTYDLRGRKKTLSDPDTGNYGYDYNAFGELIRQTDGKNQPTNTRYDKLGRVKQRSANGELISDYTYDNCTKGLGKLCNVTAKGSASPSGSAGAVGHSRTLSYDSVGRLSGETTLIGTKNYSASTTFDAAGRVNTNTYPNGQFVTRIYDQVGGWNQLIGSGGNVLWQGGAVDAEAHWLNWKSSSGTAAELTTTASFGANTGRLAGLATSGSVQALSLTYDGFGNIKTRLDAANGYTNAAGNGAETFAYDTLNQLTQANFKDGTQNIAYDGFGRIITKTGVNAVSGSYQYLGSSVNGSTTTNRIQSANGRGYTYDGNGSVDTISSTTGTSAGQAAGTITLSWTAFNQPLTLPVAAAQNAGATATGNVNAVIDLKYGADNQRVLEQLPTDNTIIGANQIAYRYILHSGASLFYEEDARNDGTVEQRAYLTGPLGVVAVHTTNSDGIPTTSYPRGSPVVPIGQQLNAQNNNGTPYTLTYWHRDHLGSLTVTTDENGQVRERMRFDPWGKPMPGTGTSAANGIGSKTRTGDRGFTGHEHLAGGLIHMNGRIYDPVLGRFLSADIVVQMPSVIGSYNRYSYVLNNPLAMTDPSGYFFVIDDIIIAAFVSAGVSAGYAALATYALIGAATAAATGHNTAARRFLGAAIMFATGGLSGPDAAFLQAAGSFAAGGIQSGSLEGAVVAGISFGIGQIVGPILAEVLTSAVTALSNAFATEAYAQTLGGYQVNQNYAGGGVTDVYVPQTPRPIEKVVITAANSIEPTAAEIAAASQPYVDKKALANAAGLFGGVLLGRALTARAVSSPAIPTQARLPQDIAAGKVPPPALPTNRPIGLSPTQNAEAQKLVQSLETRGYTDVRVNQQQVNAAGERVGINRPDIQATSPSGQREYWEFDRSGSLRGPIHEARILANDPSAVGRVNLRKFD